MKVADLANPSSSTIRTVKVTKISIWKIVAIVLVVILAYSVLPTGKDWEYVFQPSAKYILEGKSPYDIPSGDGFHNPPWILILTVPLSLLPLKVGSFILMAAGFCAYLYIATQQEKGSIVSAAFFILSPLAGFDIAYANIGWLVMLGYYMPPQIGLFFVLLKPQMGIGMALYWLYNEFRIGGIKRVFITFAPVTASILLSFAIWGIWPLNVVGLSERYGGNISFFPYSLFVAILFLFLAIAKQNRRFAYCVGPLLSPYNTIYSWVTVHLATVKNSKACGIFCVFSWIFYLVAVGVIKI